MSKGENMVERVSDSREFRIACAAVMEEAKPRALTIEQIRNLAFARLRTALSQPNDEGEGK